MKQDLQHGFAWEMRIKEQEKSFACTLVPHILNFGREKPGSKWVWKNKMMWNGWVSPACLGSCTWWPKRPLQRLCHEKLMGKKEGPLVVHLLWKGIKFSLSCFYFRVNKPKLVSAEGENAKGLIFPQSVCKIQGKILFGSRARCSKLTFQQ